MIESFPVLGHRTHRYRSNRDLGTLDPARYPVQDCQEAVMDARGRLFQLTNDVRNTILIDFRSGQLLNAWGTKYPGSGTEILYLL